MQPPKSNAEASLAICSLFESEILLRLMMRHWEHPRADDDDFQTQLLEAATEVLKAACVNQDHVFIDGLPASAMNFVAAIWYAENLALEELQTSHETEEMAARVKWLESIRRALPSCFCDPNELA